LNEEEDENVIKLQDDLESTKQLLELEVRSKKLLEKDNKRLQQEMENLKKDFAKLAAASGKDDPTLSEVQVRNRRNSIASKRQSMIKLLSEDEDDDFMTNPPPPAAATNPSSAAATEAAASSDTATPVTEQATAVPDQELTEEVIDEEPIVEVMREEVDEALKLAEEWELKYKEIQRQMSEMEGGDRSVKKLSSSESRPSMNRNSSIASAAVSDDVLAEIYHTQHSEPSNKEDQTTDDSGWMQKREIHQAESKLRAIHDKREMVTRERRLLNERIEALTHNIGTEVEARKRLRKEIKEMNEAFKQEILDMCTEQQTAEELEDCYFSDEEDLVTNTHKKDTFDEDEDDIFDSDEDADDVEETLDDIIKAAEDEDEDEDPAHDLFDNYPESDDEEDMADLDDEAKLDKLNENYEAHTERVATMRRSNFMMKSKIDRLYDILQMQKEKHHDLNQELTRMLADIQ